MQKTTVLRIPRVGKENQAGRIFVWQRSENHGLDYAEDRCIRADADSKSEDCYHCESSGPGQ
jgi:hypothetical protein